MDGIRGPVLSGTGYYMARKALFGTPNKNDGKSFGLCEKLIESLSGTPLEEAKILASCSFETNSIWGSQVGFTYKSLLESSVTGFLLHCKGWTSIYYYPERPAFLGCAPVDMKVASTQILKWISGLFLIGVSRLNPLTYGVPRMGLLQRMCYAYFMYQLLYALALLMYGTVPQLCFLNGIPLYPKVSDPWFLVFVVIYISSIFENLHEAPTTNGTIKMWWNEYKIWIIFSLTSVLFGGLDAFSKLIGLQKDTFRLTNKALDDDEKLQNYKKGKFDFRGAEMIGVPLSLIAVLNVVCLAIGVKRVIQEMNFDKMFIQILISLFFIFLFYSVVVGMVEAKCGRND